MKTCLLFLFVFLLLTIGSCAAQKNNGRSYYHEDLYYLRPKFLDPVDSVPQANFRKKKTVIPFQNVNYKVDDVLDSINRFNTTRKFIDGFTIRLRIDAGAAGVERKRARKRAHEMTHAIDIDTLIQLGPATAGTGTMDDGVDAGGVEFGREHGDGVAIGDVT